MCVCEGISLCALKRNVVRRDIQVWRGTCVQLVCVRVYGEDKYGWLGGWRDRCGPALAATGVTGLAVKGKGQ